jgi:hypothetical protein
VARCLRGAIGHQVAVAAGALPILAHPCLRSDEPCREHIMNIYQRPLAPGALPCLKPLPSRLNTPCYPLFSRSGIEANQSLGPDLFSPRARDARGRFARVRMRNFRRVEAPGIRARLARFMTCLSLGAYSASEA